jgi:hypothetical protein
LAGRYEVLFLERGRDCRRLALADALAFVDAAQERAKFPLQAAQHWVVIQAAADETVVGLVGAVEAAHRLAGQV